MPNPFVFAREAAKDGNVSGLRQLASQLGTPSDSPHAGEITIPPIADPVALSSALEFLTRLTQSASESISELVDYSRDAQSVLSAPQPTKWQLTSGGRSLAVLFTNCGLLELQDTVVVQEQLERLVFAVDCAYLASIDRDGDYTGVPNTGIAIRLADTIPVGNLDEPIPDLEHWFSDAFEREQTVGVAEAESRSTVTAIRRLDAEPGEPDVPTRATTRGVEEDKPADVDHVAATDAEPHSSNDVQSQNGGTHDDRASQPEELVQVQQQAGTGSNGGDGKAETSGDDTAWTTRLSGADDEQLQQAATEWIESMGPAEMLTEAQSRNVTAVRIACRGDFHTERAWRAPAEVRDKFCRHFKGILVNGATASDRARTVNGWVRRGNEFVEKLEMKND